MKDNTRVLLIGATGFVGAHAYPALVADGFDVLCGTRAPGEAFARDPSRTYVQLDLSDPASVMAALEDVQSAVYLAHSIGEDDAYADVEQRHAETFRDAVAACGLERVVYLGGMRPRGTVSRHLESRLRTGEILRSGTVKAAELQATMIIGAGSASFQIVRDLAARLPWMLLPRWLRSETQPVAIGDVSRAIAHALRMPLAQSCVLTLPGPERLSGRDILLRTAHLLGQHPVVVEVPLVTPSLSSHWIRLVTRADPTLARELVQGLLSDIVSTGPEMWSLMPGFERTPFDEAVRVALAEEAATVRPTSRVLEHVVHWLARG